MEVHQGAFRASIHSCAKIFFKWSWFRASIERERERERKRCIYAYVSMNNVTRVTNAYIYVNVDFFGNKPKDTKL